VRAGGDAGGADAAGGALAAGFGGAEFEGEAGLTRHIDGVVEHHDAAMADEALLGLDAKSFEFAAGSDKILVELMIECHIPHDSIGARGAYPATVRPVLHQGGKGVGYGKDPGTLRNFLGHLSVWISASVQSFVVQCPLLADIIKAFNAAENFRGKIGMFVNNCEILAGQPLLLLKNFSGDYQLADIVQESGNLYPVRIVFLETAVVGQGDCDGGYPA